MVSPFTRKAGLVLALSLAAISLQLLRVATSFDEENDHSPETHLLSEVQATTTSSALPALSENTTRSRQKMESTLASLKDTRQKRNTTSTVVRMETSTKRSENSKVVDAPAENETESRKSVKSKATPHTNPQETVSITSTDSSNRTSLGNLVNRTGSMMPAYVDDDLCTACRFARVGPKANSHTCNWVINGLRKKLSPSEAGIHAYQQHNVSCARCRPEACKTHEKRYWRLDRILPKETYAQTHVLNTIPQKHRFPSLGMSELTDYFENENNTVFKGREYFTEFNPTIIKLPETQIPSFENGDRPVYLAAYRISNRHSCFDANHFDLAVKTIGTRGRPKRIHEFLGFALLDLNLNILREVVTDIHQVIKVFEDPRLFVLNNSIYVGSFKFLTQIWVVPPPEMDGKTMIPPKFPGSMDVFTEKKRRRCTRNKVVYNLGKNLAYFTDSNNRTILEHDPMGNLEEIDLDKACSFGEKEDVSPTQIHRGSKPIPSFGTVDELFYDKLNVGAPTYTNDRGSACCTEIIHPKTGETLLVGISHSKTRYRLNKEPIGGVPYNSYFSSFYAMKPGDSFEVVARTGNVCFGHRQVVEDGGNPYHKIGRDPLWIGQEFDCPRIHYVSSLIEKADDPSQLIVSYGVNDCYPRFVVIPKADVATMLFEPEKIVPRS